MNNSSQRISGTILNFEKSLKEYGVKDQTFISLEDFFGELQQDEFYKSVECYSCHWQGREFGFTKKKHTKKITVLRVWCPNCLTLIAYLSNSEFKEIS